MVQWPVTTRCTQAIALGHTHVHTYQLLTLWMTQSVDNPYMDMEGHATLTLYTL